VANGITTVHLAYVREGARHALIAARQQTPREHAGDPVKQQIMGCQTIWAPKRPLLRMGVARHHLPRHYLLIRCHRVTGELAFTTATCSKGRWCRCPG
jgi:hypothetical protein